MTSTGRASGAASAVREGVDPRYRVAFLDWLSCCSAGASERAARCAQAVADGVSDRVRAAAIAGHVLDFDDTYVPGLAHLSAPTAPVALILGAELGATIGDVLRAYAEGFEAMGALARSSHPALYQRGWHPTAVCGAVGAAVTAAVLLRHARDEIMGTAARLALAQAGGLRRSFGSDAKSIQVGTAAAAGLIAARLASLGATATADLPTGPGGFDEAFGATWAEPSASLNQPDGRRAVAENWIKAYPCCLQTHAPIEAAAAGSRPGPRRCSADRKRPPPRPPGCSLRRRAGCSGGEVLDPLRGRLHTSIRATARPKLLSGSRCPSPSAGREANQRPPRRLFARNRRGPRGGKRPAGPSGLGHRLAEQPDDRRSAVRQGQPVGGHASRWPARRTDRRGARGARGEWAGLGDASSVTHAHAAMSEPSFDSMQSSSWL